MVLFYRLLVNGKKSLFHPSCGSAAATFCRAQTLLGERLQNLKRNDLIVNNQKVQELNSELADAVELRTSVVPSDAGTSEQTSDDSMALRF